MQIPMQYIQVRLSFQKLQYFHACKGVSKSAGAIKLLQKAMAKPDDSGSLEALSYIVGGFSFKC